MATKETKKCAQCGKVKRLDNFYKEKRAKDGLRSACKECLDVKNKKYREENKEKIKRAKKKYRLKNLKRILKNDKRYREANKGRIVEYRKEYHIKNRVKILEKVKRHSKQIAMCKAYVKRLVFHDDPIADAFGRLMVSCTYCGGRFYPTISQVQCRITALNRCGGGEGRFYCSVGCKKGCPIFNKIKYPEGFLKGSSREVQPQLRQIVLLRDGYMCQICEEGIKDAELHCHHITGIEKNPIESADIDNCITLCKRCHKETHSRKDCRYFELRCKKAV